MKYTDAGTILLGFMLEEIFQEPATELFQEQVLEPLGMMNSLFYPIHPNESYQRNNWHQEKSCGGSHMIQKQGS